MKLRMRLFLWIGSLFFISFFLAGFIEAFLTKSLLEKSKAHISSVLEQVHRQRRERMINFVDELMAQDLGKIDTLLHAITSNPLVASQFVDENGTWKSSGNLLFMNKWVDIFQNTVDGKLAASILLRKDGALQPVEMIATASNNSEIARVKFNDKEWTAVLVPLALAKVPQVEGLEKPLNVYLFFTDEQLSLLKNIQFNAAGLDELAPVAAELQQYLRAAAEPLEWVPMPMAPTPEAVVPSDKIEKFFLEQVDSLEERYDLTYLVRALTSLLTPELFGLSPQGSSFPFAMALFPPGQNCGRALTTNSALLNELLHKSGEKDFSRQRLFFRPLILSDTINELFLAASYSFISASKKCELALGISLNRISGLVEDALNLPVFYSYGGKMYFQGSPWDEYFTQCTWEAAMKQDHGIITAGGCEFFFIQMRPIPGMDLHFFAVNLAEREFEILHAAKKSSSEVITGIINRIWFVAILAVVIVLALLSRLSKSITDPITKLATATSALRGGRLSEVNLPKSCGVRKDEVQTLYLAFGEMVESLKDQEKVRAALNKVVSPTIATEILKSGMKLGGEKKRVCIMFADIRGFTRMTENMEPENVIVMLNHCMTKVSHVIDEKGGLIDKYVGDAIMALFGIPQSKSEDPLQAIEAAFEIQNSLSIWNKERAQEGKPLIYMGIGIDIGEVIAGNMGAEDRQNYTVLGSYVNVASRLCSIAEPGQILFSERVAQSPGVKEQFIIREIGKEKLKGFSELTTVYEVVSRCSIV